MSAAAVTRRAASGCRGGNALHEIAHISTRRGLATLREDDAAVSTSRSSCRDAFGTRSYPQILLKTLEEETRRSLDGPSEAGEKELEKVTRPPRNTGMSPPSSGCSPCSSHSAPSRPTTSRIVPPSRPRPVSHLLPYLTRWPSVATSVAIATCCRCRGQKRSPASGRHCRRCQFAARRGDCVPRPARRPSSTCGDRRNTPQLRR